MLEVVNIVAGGDLYHELDLGELHSYFESIPNVETHYDSESSNAVQLRFEEKGPLCMVYRTGKFVITGSENNSGLVDNFNALLKEFEK